VEDTSKWRKAKLEPGDRISLHRKSFIAQAGRPGLSWRFGEQSREYPKKENVDPAIHENEYNPLMNTQTRLANLIKSDMSTGKKVKFLEVDSKDRASLIDEIGKAKGPLAKQMKTSGIDVAMPSLSGIPIRWEAAMTRTQSE